MAADILVRPLDRWPDTGRLALVDSIQLSTGGLAHTTSVTLARLGVWTGLVGHVGADPFGAVLIEVLRRHGIEVHIREHPDASTCVSVCVISSSGERTFFHVIGANALVVPEDVPDALLASTKVLHIGGYFLLPGLDGAPAARLLQRAKRAGCRTSIDLVWDARGQWMRALAPCLPHADLLFGNLEELASVTGVRDPARIAAMLIDRGVSIVAVKMGEDGSYVDGGTWRGHVPAFVVEAVDTTGAGDAYCGGFLAGCLAGWDLESTTRFANGVGAMCVTQVGGTTGVRSMAETLEFIKLARVR